ncbi:MAG: radical SAM protein [Candidatus Magnetomorum sp.]|nr:radical SAM protein [Candidatus Magnetomorum sp.]
MKVLLISANNETISMPVLPLGLGCIARATEDAGHDIQLINMMDHRDGLIILKKSIEEFNPHVIGISVRNIDDQVMTPQKFLLEPVKFMISFCRKCTDVPVVIGGPGYSIFPQSALDYLKADMGFQGEGEKSFLLLLERLEKNANLDGIPGLYLPLKGLMGEKKIITCLDDYPLPLPNIHIWAPSEMQDQTIWIPFQTRRGCPMKCTYCSTSIIEGEILRTRNPQYVVKNLSQYCDAGFNYFYFVDNNFNLPLSYAKKICDLIISEGLNISWRCIVYPWKVDTELIQKMSQAGCKEVSLGFESGSAKILQSLNKKCQPQDIIKISETFKKFNIKQMGFLLLGSPLETKETVQESLDFADSLELDSMRVTVGIRIYPYTQLAKQAVDDGIISPDDNILFPKFYIKKGLEHWLQYKIDDLKKDRPHWF